MSALPAILWIIGVACSLLVIAICVLRSHYFNDRDKPVHPVSWSVVGMHFVTLVMVAAPYPIFLSERDSLKPSTLALYGKLGWPSAIVAIAVILAELVLMYLQARRAMKSQVEDTLKKANALGE
ncbi:hypothetical protein [Bifidobacterium choloepi]|uniref:C4-dicarboxylate ABC transporter n=1 Tax=Bifidobacterium choloepi TaxID=2614131 RepID=A0A6I5NJP6_9BIFI|nr:hypothetical protein [Bifidobacterium choloepi]NEG69092.1 hypothetical protein [Bifidobacterium choloepi]